MIGMETPIAEAIEAELNRMLDELAKMLNVEPGPERGLGWGANGQGRIVIPLDVVAKLAAGAAAKVRG
ncbi:hypothetical protein GCM10010168_85710 [Actinoplanes ianthinogenes]|uniref:Uncharacterized protein n=1 Tax=Actinoplanes ianthinogenes TaxID=122358 RepID=A0ABM7M111_9ACTN|nr:hypothetical protein [Actinoplanes ianthinogenes]BCJ45302.1 hypothetical protein Aiant_59590 [Actinoplanes ianthinogenes]GGR53660.1 hypothetical protein GCM10010168_85710 [Actinoplanes ianthinogenes]